VIGEIRYCEDCGHRCHCYDSVCIENVGIGMKDKSEKCGCGVCNCLGGHHGRESEETKD